MGDKMQVTGSLDSALALYQNLHRNRSKNYDLSEEAVSEFGVSLLHRLKLKTDAIRVFSLILEQHPDSPTAMINLAEARLLNNEIEATGLILKNVKSKIKNNATLSAHVAFLENAVLIKKEKNQQLSETTDR
jgi:hypothetical protein